MVRDASIPPAIQTSPGVVAAGLAPNGIGWAITTHDLEVSADRGRTWLKATPPGVNPTSITSVDVGLWPTVQLVSPEGSDHVRVFTSVDRGASWTSTTGPNDGAPDGFMDAKVQFVDTQTGFVEAVFATNTSQSLAELLRTSDGGKTWHRQDLPVAGSIEFGSATSGWLVGGTLGDQFLHTRDGGATWKAVTIPVPATAAGHKAWPQLPAISGDNLTMAVLFGVDGGGSSLLGVYQSVDGGTTWNPAGPPTMLSVDGSGGAVAAGPDFVLASSPAAKGFLSVTASAATGATSIARGIASSHGGGAGTSATDTTSVGLQVSDDGTAWSLEMYSTCRAPKDCSMVNSLWASGDHGATWTELHP